MAGTEREREPYSRPSDSYGQPQVAHKPTRMDPPYTPEGSDGRRSEHPKPSTGSSSVYYNGERTRTLPHIDTRRGSRGDGRRSVEASPRDTPFSGGYTSRRRENDRGEDRFAVHSRRDSTDGVFGTGSSAGGRTPSTAAAMHTHSPTMSALSSTPQQSNALGPAADLSTNARSYSGIISDASYSYVEFMDAKKRYHAAKAEKVKHEEHFTNFPVMRERYEGALIKAEKEMRKAQEEWNVKGILVDTFLKSIIRAQQPQQFEEMARRVSQEVIYKDIGTSSIEKYIEKAVNEKVSSLVPAGIAELREEMMALKDRDQRRSTELAELTTYCKTSISKLETGWKAVESKQTFLNGAIESMRTSMHSLKKDVLDAQQLAVMASDAMQKLDGLKTRVDQYEEDVKRATSALSTVSTELVAYKSQQEQLQQQLNAGQAHNALSPPGDYVTKDVLDRDIEILKEYVEKTMVDISEECSNGTAANKRADESITKLTADLEAVKLQNSTTAQAVAGLRKEYTTQIGTLNQSRMALEQGFGADIESIRRVVGQHENRLEALVMGVKHCDERLSEWSTKEFYEKVVGLLCQRIPSLFDIGGQLQNLVRNYQGLATKFQNMAQTQSLMQQQLQQQQQHQQQHQQQQQQHQQQQHLQQQHLQHQHQQLQQQQLQQQHTNAAQSNVIQPNGTSPPLAGNAGSTANGHPDAETIRETLRKLEETAAMVGKLEEASESARSEAETFKKRLDEHIDEFKRNMSDIYDWSRGVVEAMSRQHDVSDSIRDDIRNLRAQLRRNKSGSPGSFAGPEEEVEREGLKPLSNGDSGGGNGQGEAEGEA